MGKIYHGSIHKIIDYLEPRPTDEFGDSKKYCFAIKNKFYTLMFMHKHMTGFSIFGADPPAKILYIENFKNEFKKKFNGVSGYIYELSDETFYKHPKSTFNLEYVSEKPVKIIKTIVVKNVYDV